MINMPGLLISSKPFRFFFFFWVSFSSLNLFNLVIDVAQYRTLMSEHNVIVRVQFWYLVWKGFSVNLQRNWIRSTFWLFHKACFFSIDINRCALTIHKVSSLERKILRVDWACVCMCFHVFFFGCCCCFLLFPLPYKSKFECCLPT